MTRPSWHETWMSITRLVAERSYDPRLKVGAIIVSEDNAVMLALGYNGNAKGLPNVPESNEPGASAFLHAEENCLIKAPHHYPLPKVMYLTHSPCSMCAKRIINAGISRVIYDVEYRDSSGVGLLRQVGIRVERYEDLAAKPSSVRDADWSLEPDELKF